MHAPRPDDAAPALGRLLAEVGVLGDWLAWLAGRRVAADQSQRAGRPVLVIPGFLMGDGGTWPLRHALRAAGYDAHGWEMGRNLGATADTIERLAERARSIGRGARVALVGWSLGGVYARELAKVRPDLVERVVTMGTPFSGDPRANNGWRLYERVAGHPVDAPPVALDPARKPPVRTIALWTARDGVIAPAASRGRPDESDVTVEVDCRHAGFPVSRRAIAAVLAALAG